MSKETFIELYINLDYGSMTKTSCINPYKIENKAITKIKLNKSLKSNLKLYTNKNINLTIFRIKADCHYFNVILDLKVEDLSILSKSLLRLNENVFISTIENEIFTCINAI